MAAAGITLPKGVLTRACRQTRRDAIDDGGGNATSSAGSASPRITAKQSTVDPSQCPGHQGHVLIPEDQPPALPPGKQQTLFPDGGRSVMANVNISGPARAAFAGSRAGGRASAREGVFGNEGPASAVRLMFGYADNGERLSMTIDEAAWREMRARIDRAFIPTDLPGQMRLL